MSVSVLSKKTPIRTGDWEGGVERPWKQDNKTLEITQGSKEWKKKKREKRERECVERQAKREKTLLTV